MKFNELLFSKIFFFVWFFCLILIYVIESWKHSVVELVSSISRVCSLYIYECSKCLETKHIQLVHVLVANTQFHLWHLNLIWLLYSHLPAIKAVRQPKWQPFSNQFSTQMEAPTNLTAIRVCSRLVTLREIYFKQKERKI